VAEICARKEAQVSSTGAIELEECSRGGGVDEEERSWSGKESAWRGRSSAEVAEKCSITRHIVGYVHPNHAII
jgi:hypothetical protein